MLDEARPRALFGADPMVAQETEDLRLGPLAPNRGRLLINKGTPG
jgi:hypothetical protein